jgi:hypothetical protein
MSLVGFPVLRVVLFYRLCYCEDILQRCVRLALTCRRPLAFSVTDTLQVLLQLTTKDGGLTCDEIQKYSVFPTKPALKEGNLRKLEKDAFVTGVEISGRKEKNTKISARVIESVLQSRTTSTDNLLPRTSRRPE